MLVIIGLFIVAILLFGSSAVIGAVGWVLGTIAALAAVGFLTSYLHNVTGIDAETIMFGAILGFVGLVLLGKFLFWLFDIDLETGVRRKK